MQQVTRSSFKAALLASALIAMAMPAEARYQQQGLFGGRQEPDGAVQIHNLIEPTQNFEAGVSVAQRPRPEFDPTPINLGSFQFFPSIEVGGVYNTNVYAQSSPITGDFVGLVRPAVSLFSNWSRHAIALSMQGDVGFYADQSSEDYSDGIMSFRGRYDIRNQSAITYGADYQRLTEGRTSPDTTFAAEPVTYNYYKFFGRVDHQQGKFNFRPEISTRTYDFDPTSSRTARVVTQDFRDRRQDETKLQISYDLMRFWKPFIRGEYNWRDYDSNSRRNSQGWDVVGGTGFEFSGGIITGEVFAGWMEQDYRNWNGSNRSDVISAGHLGGKMLWNITNLTSLEIEADRSIEETTGTTYRGVVISGGAVTLTHELRRNLLLEANFDASNSEFIGAPPRVDETYRYGTGLRYFFNRHLYGDLEYNYTVRSSDLDTAEFNGHTFGFRLGSQM